MGRYARVTLAWFCILACSSNEPVKAQAPESQPAPPSTATPLAPASPTPSAPEGGAAPASNEPSSKPLTAAELEQLVAPIALYPDPLLANIFMASTYPLEVVEAARWVKDPANAKLKGDALDAALAKQDWDDSVKALTPFPEVLENMDKHLDQTQKLGDAILEQQKDVMDAVQRLRKRAYDAGNLPSNDKQTVSVKPAGAEQQPPPPPPEGQGEAPPPPPPAQTTSTSTQTIIIQPTNPQTVYVPSYQPTVVYGAWPYPAYPPYYYPYPPGAAFAAGMFWGAAITASAHYLSLIHI